MGDTIRMVPPGGGAAVDVPLVDVQIYSDRKYTAQSDAERASEVSGAALEEHYSSPTNVAKAGVTAVARGFTGGGSDVFLRGVGGEDMRRELAGLREHNATLSTVGEIVGGIIPGGVGGLGSTLGARIAGEGGGLLAQVARAGVRGAVEGGVQGLGQGVSELALSDDPLSVERVASVLGSNAMFGGVSGGVVGVAGKSVGLGLSRAKRALDEAAGQGVGRLGIGDDLAALDRKGLRAAERTELDAIEAGRVPKRAELAHELASFRKEMKEQKVWLATKGIDDAEVKASAIGKRTMKADKAIDRLLDDPRALAENPRMALSHLRVQEAALDDLVNKHGPRLREMFAADTSGTRAAALDFASTALEKNRSIQTKLTELSAKPASERLAQIADAVEALSAPKPASGLASELLGGSVFGHVAGAFSGLPIVGPMIGAKAARAVQSLLSGKLAPAAAEAAARGSKAIQSFLDVGRRIGPAAPIVASKVLSSVRYASTLDDKKDKARTSKTPLADSYRARSRELRSITAPGPDGRPVMRTDARAAMADRLAPVRAAHPVVADRIESNRARAVEFLANKLPLKPDLPGMGDDSWHPSDMQMRGFARYVAAVEDPHGIVERLASGQITPEDAETMREVYPEMYAQVQAEIMMQMGELRAKLPYQRRLALSIFSGVPVDPVLDPRVLSALQGTFAAEEGTNGGIEAPKAQPQFGSVTKPEPTPAQARGGA